MSWHSRRRKTCKFVVLDVSNNFLHKGLSLRFKDSNSIGVFHFEVFLNGFQVTLQDGINDVDPLLQVRMQTRM